MSRSLAWKHYNWRVVWLSLIYATFLLPAVYVEAFYVAVVWFFGLGLGAVINKVTLGAPVRC